LGNSPNSRDSPDGADRPDRSSPVNPFGLDAQDATRLAREVQDLGFQAARLVVDQFVDVFERYRSSTSRTDSPAENGSPARSPDVRLWADHDGFRRLQSDAQRALDSYLAVVRRLADMSTAFLDGSPGAGEQEQLVFPDVAPGGRCSARLWLHNTTASAATGLRPWATGLMSHAGERLPSEAVTFDPDRVERLDPGESRPLVAMLEAPAAAPLGSYHGQVLVERLPEMALAVVVRVVAAP
jgi:hypothetical protein